MNKTFEVTYADFGGGFHTVVIEAESEERAKQIVEDDFNDFEGVVEVRER